MTADKNPVIREALLQVVENQISSLDPPETKQTYDRLLREGYGEEETRSFLAAAVLIEMNKMMKKMEPFNRQRFIAFLHALPASLDQEEDD